MISMHKFDVIKTTAQGITELGFPIVFTDLSDDLPGSFDRAPLSCKRTWRREEAAN